MNPEEGAFFDLSARIKLRVRGQDRHRYLNGQLTNDLGKASEASAMEACVLNAKGKMDAHVFVHEDGESFLIDAEPELRSTLQPRLERYVIADDVQLEDVTARLSILHVIGAEIPNLEVLGHRVAANRFGMSGFDVWIEGDMHDQLFETLAALAPFASEEAAETLRIEQGVPRWGRELTNEILPPEAGLETSAIDYEKGCYIGQEVISRMKMSGQRAKKLVGFVSEVPIEPGMKLFQIGGDAKEVGWITSATRSKRFGKEIALGYIKRPFLPDKFKLDARDPGEMTRPSVRVEIVDLPFGRENN
ncbi:MAG: tRNA-modifying protein YgfZ [Verrucomicrobiota bacterium]